MPLLVWNVKLVAGPVLVIVDEQGVEKNTSWQVVKQEVIRGREVRGLDGIAMSIDQAEGERLRRSR